MDRYGESLPADMLVSSRSADAYSPADIWKFQRKWVHAALTEAYKHHFYGNVERETARYLAMLLLDPVRFCAHTREPLWTCHVALLAQDDATQGAANSESADMTLHCMSVSGPITIRHDSALVHSGPVQPVEEVRSPA